jgi:hypothetical protein
MKEPVHEREPKQKAIRDAMASLVAHRHHRDGGGM